MDRHYLYVGSQRVHYRRSGSGSPLVVLPAFPNSALSVEALADHLDADCCVVALDLPGTGDSTSLPGEPTAHAYAQWLSDVLDALGLPAIDLLAFGASAPVASTFALRSPGRLRRLILIEPPVLTDAERTDYLEHGCPPISPDAEGSHLTKFWGRLRDSYMFRPWFDRSLKARIYRDLPLANRLYDEILDLFRAGPDYGRGLRLGWTHDWLADLPSFGSLSVMGQSQTVQRLAEKGQAAHALAAADDLGAIAHYLRSLPEGEPLLAPPPAPRVISIAGEVRRDYVTTSIGQVLVRRVASRQGGGTPLVLFHGSLWSSANLEPKLLAYSDRRPVLTFDVPGVGESPPVGGVPGMADIARVVVEALDNLGVDEVDLQGGHSGAMIAIDVAILRSERVRRVILDGVTMFSEAQLAEMLPRYLRPLQISDDGAFLNWAWQFLRDMFLWYPWYDHRGHMARSDARVLDADAQHRYFVDFLKGGRSFSDYYHAALTFQTRERAPILKASTLYCCSEDDTLREETLEASALSPNAVFHFTPGRGSPEAIATTDALYLRFLDGLPIEATDKELLIDG